MTHSSILAWKFHGQRRLAGPSPGDCKEPDGTERLSTGLGAFWRLSSGGARG